MMDALLLIVASVVAMSLQTAGSWTPSAIAAPCNCVACVPPMYQSPPCAHGACPPGSTTSLDAPPNDAPSVGGPPSPRPRPVSGPRHPRGAHASCGASSMSGGDGWRTGVPSEPQRPASVPHWAPHSVDCHGAPAGWVLRRHSTPRRVCRTRRQHWEAVEDRGDHELRRPPGKEALDPADDRPPCLAMRVVVTRAPTERPGSVSIGVGIPGRNRQPAWGHWGGRLMDTARSPAAHCPSPSPLAQSHPPSTMRTMVASMGPLFLGGVPRGTVSPLGELPCRALGALTYFFVL